MYTYFAPHTEYDFKDSSSRTVEGGGRKKERDNLYYNDSSSRTVEGEALQCEHAIVRLHDHVALLLVLVREHGVGLDQLLWEQIVQLLQ